MQLAPSQALNRANQEIKNALNETKPANSKVIISTITEAQKAIQNGGSLRIDPKLKTELLQNIAALSQVSAYQAAVDALNKFRDTVKKLPEDTYKKVSSVEGGGI